MRCACGAEADLDAGVDPQGDAGAALVQIVGGGTACLNCQTFTCERCTRAAVATDPAFDPCLCAGCNANWANAELEMR